MPRWGLLSCRHNCSRDQDKGVGGGPLSLLRPPPVVIEAPVVNILRSDRYTHGFRSGIWGAA